MKTPIFTLILLLISIPPAPAAEPCSDAFNSRDLSKDWISKQIERANHPTPLTRQIRLLTQFRGEAVVNTQIYAKHNTNYTHTLTKGDDTDQKSTGRCWLFAPLNSIRSLLIAQGYFPDSFQFSQSYLLFYSMLERVNTEFENTTDAIQRKNMSESTFRSRIEPSVFEGGWTDLFLALIEKYGIVPESAMPDTPILNSGGVKKAIEEILALETQRVLQQIKDNGGKRPSREEMRLRKEKLLEKTFEVLVSYLGIPPEKFQVQIYKDPKKKAKKTPKNLSVKVVQTVEFSPLEFKEFTGFSAKDWITLSNSPAQPYDQYYEADSKLHVMGTTKKEDIHFRRLNLNSDRREELVQIGIKNGIPLVFSADMSKYDANELKIMHPGLIENIHSILDPTEPEYDREISMFLERQKSSHQMTIRGFDRPEPKNPAIKYLVENSWKTAPTLHMYREWFQRYTYSILYPVALLSPEEKALLEEPPVQLEWDKTWGF
jgi:bleomycin hydrolase